MIIVLQILLVFTFIAKNLLHAYIGNKNDNPIVNSGFASSPQLFWFYTKPVAENFTTLKKICNYLHSCNIIILIVIIIFRGIRIN